MPETQWETVICQYGYFTEGVEFHRGIAVKSAVKANICVRHLC